MAIILQRPLGFSTPPPPHQTRHPHGITHTQAESNLIENEVQDLLTKQAIHPVPLGQGQDGFVSNLFLVPQKGDGQRPVINLKQFKSIREVRALQNGEYSHATRSIKKDDYLVKIDLKDTYFTFPVWVNHQKFLRFLWKETLHEFACLPLGLASAPRVFTKIMKPVVGLLRQLRIRIVIYLDDMLIMAQT